MKIEFESKNDGFVVITLDEYNRVKDVEKRAHELLEKHIKDILKENKN